MTCVRIFFALALVAGLGGCVSQARWDKEGSVTPAKIGEIKNLSKFGDKVYFAGQPTEADFKLLAQQGVKKVVNLRTEEEMKQLGFDEKKAAEAAGLTYIQVPIAGKGATDPEIQKLMGELDGADKSPLLLHCGSSNRVGYVWSMYRGTRSGLKPDAAIEEGKKAGLRSPELEEKSREYIARSQKP